MNQGTKGQFKVGRLVATTIKLGGTLISVTADQLNTIASITKPLNFAGVIDCSANPNYPAADAGDVYKVSVAGKIGGGAGEDVQVGDDILCTTTAVAGTQAAVGSSWTILQGNVKSTADVPASTNKNYVTDAQAVVIGNTSGTNTGDVANTVVGLAAGQKIARGVAAITGSGDVVTGLATVVSISVTAQDDLDGDALAGVSATIGDQAGTPVAGSVTIKTWKVTTGGAAGNPTMIAATAAKNVNWIAVGT